MPLQWIEPEEFLTYRNVRIFHAYKDELSDIPLQFWYSTSVVAGPGSSYEFDVRDLPDYSLPLGGDEILIHKHVIEAAIDAGLLQSETPVSHA